VRNENERSKPSRIQQHRRPPRTDRSIIFARWRYHDRFVRFHCSPVCATHRQTDRHRTRDTAAGCSQCAWVDWTVSNIHTTSETITQLVVQYSDGGTTGAAAAHSQPDHTVGRGRMGVPCPLSASLPSLLHPMSLTGHQKAQCIIVLLSDNGARCDVYRPASVTASSDGRPAQSEWAACTGNGRIN